MYTKLNPPNVYNVNPWKYGLYPIALNQVISIPAGLRSAMNAKARGTPAKLDATPQKVSRLTRTNLGKPPRIAEYASRKPNKAPPSAVIRLILMLIQYDPRI